MKRYLLVELDDSMPEPSTVRADVAEVSAEVFAEMGRTGCLRAFDWTMGRAASAPVAVAAAVELALR